jgi:iron(III) transport system permease protein
LRLARPAILAAALLMFIQTISTFDVPQLIGVPGHKFVFVSEMYQALESFPPDYGTVGVIGVFIVVIASLGLWGSRRLSRGAGTQTITGKGFRPTLIDLSRWRWAGLAASILFFLVAVALPLLILLWSSVLPGYEQPSLDALHRLTVNNFRAIWANPVLARAVRNSVLTAVVSAAIVTALTSVIAYITVKTRVRGRGLLDTLATIPIAVPSIVVGVGTLYWYLAAPLPVHLYGTLWILIAAYVTIGLPYGLRYLTPGMAQISNELEEAATVSGVTWLRSFRRVFLPLLMPSLLAAFLYTMIISFREISAAIFLYGQGTEVVSVSIFQYWSNGAYPTVAALGVLMVVFLSVMAGLVRLLSRRFGIRGSA